MHFSCLFLVIRYQRGLPPTSQQDSVLIENLCDRALSYRRTNPDSTRVLAQQAVHLSEKLDYTYGKLRGYRALGAYAFFSGKYDSAEYYCRQMYEMADTLNDNDQKAVALLNLASDYSLRTNYVEALRINQEVLEMNIVANDSSGIASLYKYLQQHWYGETGDRFSA